VGAQRRFSLEIEEVAAVGLEAVTIGQTTAIAPPTWTKNGKRSRACETEERKEAIFVLERWDKIGELYDHQRGPVLEVERDDVARREHYAPGAALLLIFE
jgi:hypothetical protein